ncbi:hypothetical protein BDP27DRAFT_1433531 [Rhodocollybia butyracea]|uniref:Uncharacterized protein n=1 Tax=Rhodocollybia butyracea TaxID=206335 RepID=A0A9P5P8B2_9AGAR|nr:hypothetical protein BDP27DRAFT_1433531 [Rhodocollybia butyracea]
MGFYRPKALTTKKSGMLNLYCIPCQQTVGQSPYHANDHKKTHKHLNNLRRLQDSSSAGSNTPAPAIPINNISDLALTRLMQTFSDPNVPTEPLPLPSEFEEGSSPEVVNQFSSMWDDLDDLKPQFSDNQESDRIHTLAGYMLNIFEHGPDAVNSDNEFDMEHSDFGEDGDFKESSSNARDSNTFNPFDGLLNKKPRTDYAASREWFPWPNRTACSLDILMHLPRSVFSVRQLELFVWLMKINGVEDVSSVKTMKELDSRLQKLYGIQTYKYKGAFGHTYYVNSLADIISQEMSNPQVREKLSFYPEDHAAKNVSEARQFARWLDEIPDDELGPMARIRGEDYYIFEPCMLRSGLVYMPSEKPHRADLGISGISE